MAPSGLGFLLGVAHRARRRAWEADLADLGLTAPQAALLRVIAAEPGNGVRGLARRLGTDPMNVRRLAETLSAAGLCEPGQDPRDGRRRPLYPTAKGTRLAGAVARRAASNEHDLVEAVGTLRYQALLDALRALVEHDRRTASRSEEIRVTR